MTNINQSAPCRVSADLREYERRQEDSVSYFMLVEKIAARLAQEQIENPDHLREMVYDYDIDVFAELAKAMSSVDGACNGDRLAIQACLNALSNIQKSLARVALDQVTERAERLAQQG